MSLADPLLRAALVIPAQGGGSTTIVNGVLFALLAGAVLYAVCRSSRRN